VFPDKVNVSPNDIPIECCFVKSSEWMMNNVKEDDVIFMKMNCEGAECDIIEYLISTGAINRIRHLLVDFDVRKNTLSKA
jgi:hypothetical protein